MRRLAISVAIVACLSAAAAVADEASSERAAQRDAAAALGLLRLPAGAERADANPAADQQLLEGPGVGRSSNPNQVSRSEFWRVPGEPWQVIRWTKAHPPAGGRVFVESRGGKLGAPAVWAVSFARRPVWNVLDGRQLAVTVAAASGGGTALRADGLATWLVPRPASERIPTGARVLDVEVRGMKPAPVTRFTVRGRTRIELATRTLNRLPLVQPGVFLCPIDRGIHAYLAFRARDGGAVLAGADAALGGCASVALTIRGAVQPALSGYGFFDDLQAALGRRIDLSPFVASSFEQPLPVARVAHGRTIGGVPFEAVAYNGGPRLGLCVQLFEAGVRRGMGCLLHIHGKRPAVFSAPACYPRALTGVGVVGRSAATTRVRFDDGVRLRPTVHYLRHPTVTTTIALKGDQIVRLKKPARVSLGYRGPFAFGFRRGVHDLDTRYGGFSRC
jgi:hypothetical protein